MLVISSMPQGNTYIISIPKGIPVTSSIPQGTLILVTFLKEC